MSATAPMTDQPVSWDEYERLGEDPRVEYVDGRLLVSPSPSRLHQKICVRLVSALGAVLPESHDVALAWAWRPGNDEFIPDVMVHARTPETARFTGVPALVVEVLSTNRSDDLVLKSGKYAAAGLPHYWTLDPRDGVLDAFVLAGTLYRREARVTAEAPREVSFGVAASVVDLSALLAD